MQTILDVKLQCPKCKTVDGKPYVFRLLHGHPDVDGDGSIGCPLCYSIAITPEEEKNAMPVS